MSMNVINSHTNAAMAYDGYKIDKDAVETMKAKKDAEKNSPGPRTSYSEGAEVVISNEGMKSYHDSILKNAQDSLHNAGVILMDYNAELGSRLPSSYGEKNDKGEYDRIYHSVTDQANSLLSAYAEMYDEIQKGYEAGTRETFVEDKTSETGYRKLTKEEEFVELDKAFHYQVGKFERRNNKDIVAALEAHAKKVSELSSGRAKITGGAVRELEKRKEELDKLPENFGKNLIGAARLFTERYGEQKAGTVDIASLLKGINIF